MARLTLSPRAMKWVHRVGYVTAPLVALQLLLIGANVIATAVYEARLKTDQHSVLDTP